MDMRKFINECPIKCDEFDCDWSCSIHFDECPEYHNLPCPKCGKGVILTDNDMAEWAYAKGVLLGWLEIEID